LHFVGDFFSNERIFLIEDVDSAARSCPKPSVKRLFGLPINANLPLEYAHNPGRPPEPSWRCQQKKFSTFAIKSIVAVS